MSKNGGFFSDMVNVERFKERMIALFVANAIMAVGIDFLRLALFGNDPFSCMNLGYSNVTGLSFGTCAIAFNIATIIPVFLYDKKYVQIGTVVNMFFLPIMADFFHPSIIGLVGTETPEDMMVRVILMAAGVTVCCYGCSMYYCSDFGMGPYDAIGWIVERMTNKKLPFKYARIILDFTAVAIGFTFGSIVGAGTVIMAFFTGPLVVFFSDKINYKLVYGHEREA